MSGNNSVGDHPVHENIYGSIVGYDGNRISYVNLEEKVELEELREKVKIYESICNPEKYKAIWYSAFYSGKLAQETGETKISDMERFFNEDMESIIQEELSNLDLSEENNGEFNEDN